MNHDVLPPGTADELKRLRESNAELLRSLGNQWCSVCKDRLGSPKRFTAIECICDADRALIANATTSVTKEQA